MEFDAPLRDVSRETIDRLEHYQSLLLKWTDKINLIAPSTISTSWERHVVDSAQIFQLLSSGSTKLTDIGSGGGLPGIVVAILAREKMPLLQSVLVESDQRKAVFLRTVVRELGLSVSVKADRIENVTATGADVLTARALAPLPKLLSYAVQLLKPDGIALFQKGRTFEDEISQARDAWDFSIDLYPSHTDQEARILQIKDIRRATK
ncbi:16S rRNA (guanine(527)-N(7))-methyltransferase RsmG [Loktanella salsilacus]|uniref:16S rRNA (guanine(527)-N(7))-methyltransferase RsmG n=1 Tax=Loktanella salsilacus TaxID=195913 RepID=UPI0020B8144D|nr:16S rRNA (guanine(527)-N(7))-methyltransferase RsmG [Loktanella salsilacus]UTH48109.1 16S rRNA (guanine(527)-N(7))-methyltransferase RsmG [Loktanella salsilacus]